MMPHLRSSALLFAFALGFAACSSRVPASPEPEPYEGSSAPWDAARQAGASFRAVGNEPGWVVSVYPDSLVYLTNYGEDRYTFTQFAARPAAGGTYQTLHPEPAFSMVVTDAPCFDDMSGEPFETTVTVEFDGWTYRGCGNRLLEHDSD